ncbi:helicase C-terminal domain-containing protein [Ramlibacter alkalitolerans]|uniref:ATP-dependent DNA helicase n=1 Tax=Ramlibacter alkalitolerans TaxID=2039631 RepID=A0ABS1JL10_9BURK|nr:helicase C-terminal domain-containing protein [Ramlibacter alkalitolerans]MBL0424910.1 ATP-dependent DNA helicase [Ramlibacter alkalitolerans]
MQYSVAVRSLCAFTAKAGDLDLRFTPAPTAQEGIAGHQQVAARRGSGYETEIPLRGEFEQLTVRGRADGYDPARNRLEEIKTHRGDLARQPANHRALHWAQAKVYGWLLCRERGLASLEVALVYFDLRSGQETILVETHSAEELRGFFEARCAAFLAWAGQELAHREARDQLLSTLPFPHASFRQGQRELAEAVYKGAATRRCVLAQAPTGIGKTVATLFAMLRAAPRYGLHKVFYLTAKSTGRQLALDAAALLVRGAGPARLRVVEITARDKACEHRDKACHGESCPLARGFYDRLPAARAQAIAGPMDTATLRRIALAHEVCPYYLAQELVQWADLVVGDYNYYFDGSALLHALTVANEWNVGVLADEAHNLVERARAMYSASLTQSALRSARIGAPAPVRTAFDRVNRHWNAMRRVQAAAPVAALPSALVAALQHAAEALEAHFAEATPHQGGDTSGLQQFYFDLLAFVRRAESFGSHSVLELEEEVVPRGRPSGTLRIQNLVPAPFLRPHLAAARTVTLFSATLSPPRYAIDLLGLPADTVWMDVESPFRPDQLQVQVVSSISTRYRHRQASAEPIAGLIGRQYHAAPGNYLAFFSSFDYLALVASEFRRRHPDVPVWEQARGMDEGQRREFLERFVPGGAGVGFAVLGGSFGEGIDLRGDRLVGAFVATLGLPQVNARNEQLRACLDTLFGAGYDYAYLVPGLQKVVQAAGRVIRTHEDRGIVVLIDDRFSRRAVRELLPAWWRMDPEAPQQARLLGQGLDPHPHALGHRRAHDPPQDGCALQVKVGANEVLHPVR